MYEIQSIRPESPDRNSTCAASILGGWVCQHARVITLLIVIILIYDTCTIFLAARAVGWLRVHIRRILARIQANSWIHVNRNTGKVILAQKVEQITIQMFSEVYLCAR